MRGRPRDPGCAEQVVRIVRWIRVARFALAVGDHERRADDDAPGRIPARRHRTELPHRPVGSYDFDRVRIREGHVEPVRRVVDEDVVRLEAVLALFEQRKTQRLDDAPRRGVH